MSRTEPPGDRIIETAGLTGREQYQLLSSLVVPRPIAWVSTWDQDGGPNLAPFSYFAALSTAPLQVGISIGHRRTGPKDTLVNVREHGAFCVNVVTTELLLAMNATAAEVDAEIDEFELAGLTIASSERIDAPYVVECPAVMECRLVTEVELGEARNTLIIGEVMGVRLSEDLPLADGTLTVDPEALRPVGRLGGSAYAMPGEVLLIGRPG